MSNAVVPTVPGCPATSSHILGYASQCPNFLLLSQENLIVPDIEPDVQHCPKIRHVFIAYTVIVKNL